jgi:hypothetical protein
MKGRPMRSTVFGLYWILAPILWLVAVYFVDRTVVRLDSEIDAEGRAGAAAVASVVYWIVIGIVAIGLNILLPHARL